MPTYRFPVLVWEDFEGCYTAGIVEDEANVAAVGPTADDAVSQVEEYLSWLYKRDPHLCSPDFLDARLVHFTVEVRPEYRTEDRIFPCSERAALLVACVHGRQEGGLLVCALPIIGIRFYYYEPDKLKGLVAHYVQDKLKGLTPRELSRYLPPKNVTLEEVVLQVPRKEQEQDDTPTQDALALVAEPLGERRLRSQFSRAWERDGEVADLVQRLGKEKANVILVGEAGVGKTTVLVDTVRKLEQEAKKEGEWPSRRSHRFWLTSGSRLIAGMRYLGQWQERCEEVVEELSDCDAALCVDNLLELARIGGDGPGDSIAAFFLPYIQRGELRLVSEATPAELDACRRLLPGLVDLFQILHIPNFDRQTALSVLGRIADFHGQNVHIGVEKGVADLVHRLFSRFVPYQTFPGKAAAFMRRLFEGVSQEHFSRVTLKNVVEGFVRDTGLPELFLRDELPLNQTEVEHLFKEQVIGQDEACQAATRLVVTFKAGLNDPTRPLGVLLFCGPTGVGKTELAKAISRCFFGHGEQTDRMARLDMSEYAGPGAAERLIGESDGEPSDLIKRVRQQPFLVLLLDEIEKAAPEVFDVLLGVLDEGRLTDKYGRTTTFRSAVIIMTSNLGAERQESLGFGAQPTVSYDAEAMSFFRPEFYNRIDAVVTFKPLEREAIHAITIKELAEIAQREGLTKANIRLSWTDSLVEYLAQQGFDRRYGARPLQRTLERLVVTPLARYLVEHSGIRDAEIRMDLDAKGSVVFTG